MQPVDIQHIGSELAVKWDSGEEDFIRLEALRRHCPCASCQGEVDVMGQLHKGPDKPLTANSTKLIKIAYVGGCAIQPVWGDGHSTGIISFDFLKRIASAQDHE